MTNTSPTAVPSLTIKAGQVFANSREVAAYFEKRHDNVLRAIDNLECSAEFRALNFEETPYVHPQNGQTYRSFDMTRNGFTFLAMGFTGKQALQFKLKYIAAFNEMEAKLQALASTTTNLDDPAAAARAWAAAYEQQRLAEQKARELISLPLLNKHSSTATG